MMPAPRREPEWVGLFLAALGSCGNVTRSAALAGVDVTGPYNRRARYPGFREAWELVMAEREARAAGSLDTIGMIGALRDGPSTGSAAQGRAAPGSACSVSPQDERLALSSTGVRLGRGAVSRWSKGAEARFLEELTASANVARAAAAAGFSAAAVYKRKVRDPHFAAGWDAAIAVGRSRLEAHLLDAADRAFDPEALPIAEGSPKVTVSEAISILKHKPAGNGNDSNGGFMTWKEEADSKTPDEMKEVRERILEKLERFRVQETEDKLEKGWTRHGDDWIPPGWGPGAGEAGAAET